MLSKRCKSGSIKILRPCSRVEERRGNAGMMPSSRFLSPLIEPDVQISRIRLSDWFRVRLTAASTA